MDKPTTTLQVTHQYDHPPQAVYDAFLNPKYAHKWFFATEAGEMVVCEIDASVGGKFTMTDRRNGEDVAHVGTFLELDPPHRIVFTLQVPKYSDEMDTLEIDIKPTDYGCELTLTHTYAAEHEENSEQYRAGWNMILGNFRTWAFPAD
ncbi:MAG: SRPBCC domain-containing protein [Fimbriimonadaceae bacterium]|nr:MAG: SRPBCC domain-containing protein [Fimbriimonadaceae bacterium]